VPQRTADWLLLAFVGDYGVHKNAMMGAQNATGQNTPTQQIWAQHLEEISSLMCTDFQPAFGCIVMILVSATEPHSVMARLEQFDSNEVPK
jgi:hypothetical protein